jgi:hypothetical protein
MLSGVEFRKRSIDQALISSYKRSAILSRILSFLGILVILYYIYSDMMHNDLPLAQNNIESSAANLNELTDKPNYQIKILNSTFKGLNKNLNPYQIQATQAIKNLDNNYTLESINSMYKIDKLKELVINAKNGTLNETNKILSLENEVVFFLENATLRTAQADLNLLNKETFAKSGVVLSYKNSTIISDKFSSVQDNDLINFQGRVSTIIDIEDFSGE